MRVLFLVLVLTSCGTDDIPDIFEWDSELVSYYHQFKNDLAQYNIETPDITYVSTTVFWPEDNKFDLAGVCEVSQYMQVTDIKVLNYKKVRNKKEIREVFIQPKFRAYIHSADIIQKNAMKNLMYHEFGHCFFDLEHVEDEDNIMYDTIIKRTPEESELAFQNMVLQLKNKLEKGGTR